MKKPLWAKHLAYKVVSSEGFSVVPLFNRVNDHGGEGGSILWYGYNTIVKSPNGVCTDRGHECCRGIHAYRTKCMAVEAYNNSPSGTKMIIEVYAQKWYGQNKLRASRVFVGAEVK